RLSRAGGRRGQREEAERLRRRSRGDDKERGGVPVAYITPSKPQATQPAYSRILLKLSGEALMGPDAFGINRETVDRIVAQVKGVSELGVQGAVVGGRGGSV